MELNEKDRGQLASVADDIVGYTAIGEHRGALLLHQLVRTRWGSDGARYVLHLQAEMIVRDASGLARTPYAKVVPETALPPARYAELAHQLTNGDAPRMDRLCALTADYLNSVQLLDRTRQLEVEKQVAHGERGDEEAVQTLIREIAARHVRTAQELPRPPSTYWA